MPGACRVGVVLVSSQRDSMTHAERAALGLTRGDADRASLQLMPTPAPIDRRPRISSKKDAFNLLAYVAAFDSRARGDYEATAWADALGPEQIAFEDAKRAVVAHFNGTNRHRWITPGDIIEQIEEGL